MCTVKNWQIIDWSLIVDKLFEINTTIKICIIFEAGERSNGNIFSFWNTKLRACDIQEVSKFEWFQVSTFLSPKYIQFCFENVGNGREDENGSR